MQTAFSLASEFTATSEEFMSERFRNEMFLDKNLFA